MNHPITEYTYLGLCNYGKRLGPPSLAYLIGLVNSADHKIGNPFVAKRILTWILDEEEQVTTAAELLSRQKEFFSRYFDGGYQPQSPVMLAKRWSPISAILERGLKPLILLREEKIRATATGIWQVTNTEGPKTLGDCRNVEELFWSVFCSASRRAQERQALVSIIAKPGWAFETIGSNEALPRWSPKEVASADRILWKRTPGD